MDEQHRLTAVLADGTRYRIYRSIVEQPHDEVTVAAVATTFGLHPNVARMHLTKLPRPACSRPRCARTARAAARRASTG